MVEFQQSRDVCIEKLTSTSGVELEITANITHPSQLNAVMEGYVCRALNVQYGIAKYQMLLRLTDSYKARCRDDLGGIGKVPEPIPGWNMGKDDST